MAKGERDLYGTIELLVLKALSWAPTHGFGIARWIELVSGDDLRVEEGSLCPALYRLEPETARDAALARFGDLADVRARCLTIAHRRERRMKRLEIWSTLRQHAR